MLESIGTYEGNLSYRGREVGDGEKRGETRNKGCDGRYRVRVYETTSVSGRAHGTRLGVRLDSQMWDLALRASATRGTLTCAKPFVLVPTIVRVHVRMRSCADPRAKAAAESHACLRCCAPGQ
jgi:hypothetical protein